MAVTAVAFDAGPVHQEGVVQHVELVVKDAHHVHLAGEERVRLPSGKLSDREKTKNKIDPDIATKVGNY